MNQILHCDWLPEQARWRYLARSGLTTVSHRKYFPKSHIINPLLTKLVRSRWLDIYLYSILVHKHKKEELGQYLAIFTSCLVNNPYLQHFIQCVESFTAVSCDNSRFDIDYLSNLSAKSLIDWKFKQIDANLTSVCKSWWLN